MSLAKSILSDVLNALRAPISVDLAAMNVVNSYKLQGRVNSKNVKELIDIFGANLRGPAEQAILSRLDDYAEIVCD